MSNEPDEANVPQKPRPKIKLEFPRGLTPIYANTMIVSHTASEVILDLGQILPNTPVCKIQGRVVMTAMNAKILLQILGENLRRFEDAHGEITLPKRGASLADQLFRSPADDAADDESDG